MTTEKDSFDQPFAEMEATEETVSEEDLKLIEMGINPRLNNAYKKFNALTPIFLNNELTKSFFDFYCNRANYDEKMSIKQDKLPQALANELITVKENYSQDVKKVEEGVQCKALLKWLWEFMSHMSYANIETIKTKIQDVFVGSTKTIEETGFGVKTREKVEEIVDGFRTAIVFLFREENLKELGYKTTTDDVAKLTEIDEVVK